jgi:hypothetical protein
MAQSVKERLKAFAHMRHSAPAACNCQEYKHLQQHGAAPKWQKNTAASYRTTAVSVG